MKTEKTKEKTVRIGHRVKALTLEEQKALAAHRKAARKRVYIIVSLIVIVLFFAVAFLVPTLFGDTVLTKIVKENVLGVINIAHFFESHVEAILRTITTLFVGMVILYAVLFVVNRFKRGSQRQRTLVTLIASFVRYTGVILLFFVLLGLWGVDTTALLAGVGALALIIGLGAQSLVADILAGLFIVFENAFQVDDIITVDGFRGTVIEIGLRTTRLQDSGGDIKTVNNSEMKMFVNMSRATSWAAVDVTVEYGENLEKVEKLIKDNLEILRKKLPAVTEQIKYLGLDSFTERGSLLKISATCQETDRLQLARDLNRELKILFDKHSIKIAVPNVRIK